MPKAARTLTEAEQADVIAADAMLTLAESNLRAAVELVRQLRYDEVPVRLLAARLGLSHRAVHGLGVAEGHDHESGPLSTALTSLTTARQRGTDRRRTRSETRR